MLHIRNAESADVQLLKNLIDQMGEYERLPVSVTHKDLAADGFGETPRFHALIAEWHLQPAGYALFYDCYSSFRGRGIFLEDLFVSSAFRGRKVGNTLLSRVAALAIEQQCFGIMFNVLGWNQPALAFFKDVGATSLADWRTLCLAGRPLQAAGATDAALRNTLERGARNGR
jgi:GNAT superfamily N-acetyltransferase